MEDEKNKVKGVSQSERERLRKEIEEHFQQQANDYVQQQIQ